MSLNMGTTSDTLAKQQFVLEPQDQTLPNSLTQETVLSVKHWTDKLFSFCITRPPAFRFRSGEFIMLGLFKDKKPLLRAYSMTSPSWDDKLDFFSIKVQHGPLTSRLQHIKSGDKVLLGKKPTGTITLDALTPAKNLYMLSTGTGIAPFLSLIRDPETFAKFENVVLTHTCRKVADLKYGQQTIAHMKNDPLVGKLVKSRLTFYTTTTQENFHRTGRITTMIESGDLFREINKKPLQPKSDRVMICGSTAMLQELSMIAKKRDFIEGSHAVPADFVIEKAFVS